MPKRKNEEDHHRTYKDDAGHTHVQDADPPSDTEDNGFPASTSAAPQQQRKKFVRKGTASNANNSAGSGLPATGFSFGSGIPATGSGSGSGSGFAFGSSGPTVPSFGLAMGSSSSGSKRAAVGSGASSQAPTFSFGAPQSSGIAGGSFQSSADIIKGSVVKPSAEGTVKVPEASTASAFRFGSGSHEPLPSISASRSPPHAATKGQSKDEEHSKMLKLNEDLEEHISQVRGSDPCADLTIVFQKYIEYAREIKSSPRSTQGSAKSVPSPSNKAPTAAGAAPVPSPPPAPPAASFSFGAPKSPPKPASSEPIPKLPAASVQGFSFGAPSPSSAPVTSASPKATSQASSFGGTAFAFGAPSAPASAPTPSAPPAFTFGTAPAGTSPSAAPASTPIFSFGSSGSTAAPALPSFGGTSSATPTAGGFTFGGASGFSGFGSAPATTTGFAAPATTASDAAGGEGGGDDDDDAPPPAPTGPAAVESSALLEGESMDFEHKFRVRVCQPDQDPVKTRVSEWPVRGVGTVSVIRNASAPSKHRLFIRTGTTVDGVVANTLLGAVMATGVKIKNKTHVKVAVFGADKEKYQDKPMMLFLSVDEEGGTGEKAAEFVEKVKACKEDK